MDRTIVVRGRPGLSRSARHGSRIRPPGGGVSDWLRPLSYRPHEVLTDGNAAAYRADSAARQPPLPVSSFAVGYHCCPPARPSAASRRSWRAEPSSHMYLADRDTVKGPRAV